jgi:hypothetical protein
MTSLDGVPGGSTWTEVDRFLTKGVQRIVLRAIGAHMVSSRLFSMTAGTPMMSARRRDHRGRRLDW